MIKTFKTAASYVAPQSKVVTIAVQRCIAVSVSGSTEDFLNVDSDEQDGFNEIHQGDF